MPDKIVVRIENHLITYNDLSDVPQEFDNLISYEPEIPEPPHTQEEHNYMDNFNNILHELLRREKK